MDGPRCPNCNSTTSSVINTRKIPDAIKRRRVCEDCGGRFTTYEKVGKVSLPKAESYEWKEVGVAIEVPSGTLLPPEGSI